MFAFAVATPLQQRKACRVRACHVRMQADKSDDDDQPPPSLSLPVSRRRILQAVSGVALAASLRQSWLARESLHFMSPASLLAELGLSRLPARAATSEFAKFVAARDAEADILCPELPADVDWINTTPLSLRRDLTGHVVLIDFWTYCCINCMHVLPILERLQKSRDGRKFVVLGAHNGKFTEERVTNNIEAAVKREHIRHPVFNDQKGRLWGQLGITSWSTLLLVGPRGNIINMSVGEPDEANLGALVDAALDFYAPVLTDEPLPLAPIEDSAARTTDSIFRYPGKVTATSDGTTLFVADTTNNRVVELEHTSPNTARVVRSFGHFEKGFIDGKGDEVRFHAPQGVTLDQTGTKLYIADTGNHAVREISLDSGAVRTLGGDGTRGRDYRGGNKGRDQVLASPWDLVVSEDGSLFVSMAGLHQIWRLSMGDGLWEVASGTGLERAVDGKRAYWAQPSGLSRADSTIYVADSESSNIRALDDVQLVSRTIAGGGSGDNLFAFGDKEGRGTSVRFQHPLGVVHDAKRNVVYVADTYNNRIRVVDADGRTSPLAGSGTPGMRDGRGRAAQFWEPAGIALVDNVLYVADTNNCAIRMVDLETRSVTTLSVTG